jgi:hypothetical protein
LDSKFFDSLKRPIVEKQVFLLITFGGIEFILIINIIPTTYLRNWALVASIIVVSFMINQYPFLFEALAQINNIFLFHQHFKVACDFLPPSVRAHLFMFKHLIGQQMIQFQNSILEIIPFPTCCLMGDLKPIVPKFYHVLA